MVEWVALVLHIWEILDSSLALGPPTLIAVFHGFPKFIKTNTGKVPQIRQHKLPFISLPLILYSSCDSTLYTSSLKY
jgi:hypothetical protein